jgi:hypothetical protein
VASATPKGTPELFKDVGGTSTVTPPSSVEVDLSDPTEAAILDPTEVDLDLDLGFESFQSLITAEDFVFGGFDHPGGVYQFPDRPLTRRAEAEMLAANEEGVVARKRRRVAAKAKAAAAPPSEKVSNGTVMRAQSNESDGHGDVTEEVVDSTMLFEGVDMSMGFEPDLSMWE